MKESGRAVSDFRSEYGDIQVVEKRGNIPGTNILAGQFINDRTPLGEGVSKEQAPASILSICHTSFKLD